MNHVINSILEDTSTRLSIRHTSPALLHDVLWRALEQALKATPEDASQTPHTRACLRICAEIDTLSYLDKADSKLAAALGEAFWKLLLIKQRLFELSVKSVATHKSLAPWTVRKPDSCWPDAQPPPDPPSAPPNSCWPACTWK